MKTYSTKESLLKRLKRTQGNWISGQLLSRELSVSRAAVSKNIQILRQQGYQIEAVTNKGYRLIQLPDRLFASEIRQGLNASVFGQQKIYYYETIDSTNNQARKLADSGGAEGTLVIAESQTAGRGRRGRVWTSPENAGIYLSMIARPKLSPAKAPQMTLLTAVALANAVRNETGLAVQIKWPNDLLINNGKVGGILTELRTEMDLVDYVIIGVGLNVNTSVKDLKEVTNRKTTSVALEAGKTIERLKILRTFLHEFEVQYAQLTKEGIGPILDRFKALTNIIGKTISVDVAGQIFKGEVLDLEQTGVLVIRSANGELQRIFSGDMSIKKNK